MKAPARLLSLLLLLLPCALAGAQTNLFNSAAAVTDTTIDGTTATVSANSTTATTGLIPVTPGAVYTTASGMLIGTTRPCFFNSARQPVNLAATQTPCLGGGGTSDYLRAAGANLTVPTDSTIAFVEYTILDSQISTEMFCAGTSCPGTYTAYVAPAPTLTLASIPGHLYTDAPFTVSATTNSSGAVTYSISSGPATVSGNTVTLTGAGGTVVLQASVAATASYSAATATTSFVVTGLTPPPAGFVTLSSTRIQTTTGIPLASGTAEIVPTDANNQPIEATAGGVGGTLTSTPASVPITNGAIAANTWLPDALLANPTNLRYRLTIRDGFGAVLRVIKGMQPSSSATWCTSSGGSTICNLDHYPPNVPSQALVVAGAPGAAATVTVGTVSTGGSTPTVTNTGTPSAAILNFTFPPAVSGSTPKGVIYFEGSSIEAGQGLTCPALSDGTGNAHNCDYPSLIRLSPWGAAATALYNDSVAGQTTSGYLTDYNASNTYGPAAHTAHYYSPAVTGSTLPSYYVISTTGVTNDWNHSISTATSISNLQSTLTLAKADGWITVCAIAMIAGNGPTVDPTQAAQNKAVAQAIRNGQMACDNIVDMSGWMPDQTNTALYQDGTHPTTAGHAAIGRNFINVLNAGGQVLNYTP